MGYDTQVNSRIFEAIRLFNGDYRLLNWLNYQNHNRKKDFIIAELDDATAEIINEEKIDFSVDECKWFYHSRYKDLDVSSIELFKVYRFKPLLFNIDSIYLKKGNKEAITKMNDLDLEKAKDIGVQAAFDFEKFDFEQITIHYESSVFNIANIQLLFAYVKAGKAVESKEQFNSIFKYFLQLALQPIGYDINEIDENDDEWYRNRHFF